MSPFLLEVIPNELPFRNSFWANEQCIFCQEVFTLASFVTLTLGAVFAVLAILAVMYWFNGDTKKPSVPARPIKRIPRNLHPV